MSVLNVERFAIHIRSEEARKKSIYWTSRTHGFCKLLMPDGTENGDFQAVEWFSASQSLKTPFDSDAPLFRFDQERTRHNG